MLIDVKLKPNAKKSEIVGFDNGYLRINVKEQPIENRANKAMVELLSKYLGIAKSCIELKKGTKSKLKRIKINCLDKQDLNKFFGELQNADL